MRRIYLLLMFSLISGNLFSQVKLNGTVRDSVGKPLDVANVIAVNENTKAIESFNITDAKGQYKLNLQKNTSYKLTVSYIGMKTLQVNLNIQGADITKDFILTPDFKSLEELKVTYSIPIRISGDTMSYDAASFKNATDRKLEDVLKRLPGVEVTRDGEIKVEGKTVNQIKVEGKRFFDGNTKLASKNIPADVLDKIQVLKNQDNINQLSGVRDNSENITINIKLKEGKKNFWFGDLEGGGGPRERYLLHPKLFYYSPKQSANIIVDMNNIGDASLSFSDLNRFSISQNEIHQKSGTNFNVEAADISLSMRNNRVYSAQNKFAAANLNYAPAPFWDFTGYAIYSGARIHTQENAVKQFTQAMPVQRQENEVTSNQNEQNSDLGLFKFNSIYTPNKNNRFDYSAFGNINRRQLNRDFHSSVLQNIDERNRESPYKVSQALNYYYTLNDKNIFALESQYLSQSQNPFYNAIISRPDLFGFAANLGLDQAQSGYNINQKKQVNTNKFDASLNYWNVINRLSNINFSIGVLSSRQRFSSDIYQILDNGTRFDPGNAQAALTNDITYRFSDVYMGLRYRLKVGILIFEPASSLHAYQTRSQQFSGSAKQNFYRLLPSFNVKAQLRSSEAIQFLYKMTTRFTDVNNLAEGLILNNYSNLFQGNRELENALSHNFDLSYYSYINQVSRYHYTSVTAGINYNKTVNGMRNRIHPEGVLQVSSPFNSNFADESASANAGISKAFWRMVAGAVGSWSLNTYNQIFDGQVSRNKSISQNYSFSLRTNFNDKFPTVSIGYDLGINNYSQGIINPKFFTDRFFVNFDASFLKCFRAKAGYDYNNYRNEAKNLNRYSFLNAELGYQKLNSKWEYTLRGLNILNTQTFNQDSANEFYTITTQYYIQPRYFILSLKYTL